MIDNYSSMPNEGWVSMEKIIHRTSMSSFNQRFQEWRDHGIMIENRMIDSNSEYKLFTHPLDVDKDNFRNKVKQTSLNL